MLFYFQDNIKKYPISFITKMIILIQDGQRPTDLRCRDNIGDFVKMA